MPRGVYKRTKDVWNKGKIMDDDFRKACARSSMGNNYRWKGDDASYGAKHVWIHQNFGSAKVCMNYNCSYPRKNKSRNKLISPKTYHWANISGSYSRDMNDWIQLCPSCHSKFDRDTTFKKNVLRLVEMKIDLIKALEK